MVPIKVTALGMFMVVKEMQPSNALVSIAVSFEADEKVTVFKRVQD